MSKFLDKTGLDTLWAKIKSTYFKSSGNTTLVSGTATKIGTQNGADVKLTLPTIPAAVSVKGNAESSYRTGQVNLTPANLGISATTSSVTVGSTTFNKYTHPTTSGNKHVPSGGSSGQFLGWDSDGTAKWVANPNTDNVKATAKTDNVNYKILATASANPTSGNATEAVYDTDITLNPSTNTIAANVSGNAATATSASSVSKTQLGTKTSLPLSEMVSSAFKAGTFLLASNGSDYTFGDVTIPKNQWYRFTVSGESSNYCVITLEPVAGGSSVTARTYKIRYDQGQVTKVVAVPYATKTAAIGDSSTPVYVDASGEIKACTPSSMTVGSAANATTHIADSVVHVTAANKVLWNKAAQRAVGDTRYIAGPISSGIPIEFGAQGDNPSVKFAIGCDSGNSEIHISLRVTNGANNWMQGGGCEYCATTSSVVQTTTTNNTRGANVEFGTQENYIIGTCPIPTSSSLTTKGMYKAKLMFYDSTGTRRINILDIELCYSRTGSVFSGYGTVSVINALDN